MAKNKKQNNFVYQPWVPKTPELEDFPFSFEIINKLKDSEHYDTSLDFVIPVTDNATRQKELLYAEIKLSLIKTIDFTDTEKDVYRIKLNQYALDGKKRTLVKSVFLDVKVKNTGYNYILVKDMEHLKEILDRDIDKMAFDTETTGLDPEEDEVVGVSFCFDAVTGYYAPVAHEEQFAEFNLDSEEALKRIHEAMLKAHIVYMFNSSFDMRMMEYSHSGFNMSKVKTRDVQVSTWFADPDFFRQPSLKYSEKYFLGYNRPDLSDTLKSSRISTFNLSTISPKKILFYAAQDAISTFALGEETDKFFKEFKMSAIIDQELIYPLMKVENHSMRIDTLYLKEQLGHIMPRLEELNKKLAKEIGNVNLNSPKQKIALFKSFGLDTDKKTKTGNMATGAKEVQAMIERMEAASEPYPDWLKYLGERAKLEKLQSTFFNSLLEQAKLNGGRVRINYRNTQAATGRLSSGSDLNE